LTSRGWVDPVPDPLLLGKSGSAGDRTRDLCICSQKLWSLDHRGGLRLIFTKEKDIIKIKRRTFLSHKNTSSLIRRVSLWRVRACHFTEINVSKWNFQELYGCLNVTRLKDYEIFLCKCIVQVFGVSVLCRCFA